MLWDIFCRVIDNHGDLGVCWRLSADLASKGHDVRLWVDDASALTWMAPEVHLDQNAWGMLQFQRAQVMVRPWQTPLSVQEPVSDVWVEAFGCELPLHFISGEQACTPDGARSALPVWLNLEYLSAEPYVERSHRLPSPVMSGPLKGRTKWFFYPGFTDKTGGLIREPKLEEDLKIRLSKPRKQGQNPISLQKTLLFCYEPVALAEALQLNAFRADGHQWQVAQGRGALAFDEAMASLPKDSQNLRFSKIPPLSQSEFDKCLADSDFNFVRGEDSLVRALWAGKAFVWHIYPQEDGAHGPKLNAFLDWLEAPESLRRFHLRWNGLSTEPLPDVDLPAWEACAVAARQRLMGQMDLVSQLLQFVEEKR